jgi:hypothetical protein
MATRSDDTRMSGTLARGYLPLSSGNGFRWGKSVPFFFAALRFQSRDREIWHEVPLKDANAASEESGDLTG